MRNLILLLIYILSGFFSSCSNEKQNNNLNPADVPAVVQTSFTAKYPTATDMRWQTGKEDGKPTFKVKFKTGDKKVKAEFGEDGGFIKNQVEE